MIDQIVINPDPPISGGGITAFTAQVKTATSYGSAKNCFVGGGATVQYVATTSNAGEAAGTDVNLALVSTTSNISAATAGNIDVWITWHLLP